MRQLVELDRHECELLLRGGGIGRAAFSTPDGPHIVPLNYSVIDEAVVFATTSGSMLAKFADGADLAFEVDSIDFRQQNGWSVVVRGRSEIVTDPEDLRRITSPPWPPRPWAAGTRDTYIRLPLGEVSGRRLLARPYRENED